MVYPCHLSRKRADWPDWPYNNRAFLIKCIFQGLQHVSKIRPIASLVYERNWDEYQNHTECNCCSPLLFRTGRRTRHHSKLYLFRCKAACCAQRSDSAQYQEQPGLPAVCEESVVLCVRSGYQTLFRPDKIRPLLFENMHRIRAENQSNNRLTSTSVLFQSGANSAFSELFGEYNSLTRR